MSAKLKKPIPPIKNGKGRATNGRFAKGNAGGPGRKPDSRVSLLRQAVRASVTPDTMQAIIGALAEQAKAGDVQAARLLLDRLLGPATAPAEATLARLKVKTLRRDLEKVAQVDASAAAQKAEAKPAEDFDMLLEIAGIQVGADGRIVEEVEEAPAGV